jgi:hypothetical protein
MDIEQSIAAIEGWSEREGVFLTEGVVQSEGIVVDLFEDSIERVLSLAAHSQVNLLILSRIPFSLDDDAKDPAKEDLTSFQLAEQRKMRRYEGEICVLILAWVKEGVIFRFRQAASWYDEHLERKTEQGAHDAKDYAQRFAAIQSNSDKIAHILATHPKFFLYQTRIHKLRPLIREIAQDLGLAEGEYFDSRAKEQAEVIFQQQFEAVRLEEFREQVAELRAQGLPKKAIIQKLDVTEGIIDKVYYD